MENCFEDDISQHFFKAFLPKVKSKGFTTYTLETENFSISNRSGTLSDQFDYVSEISEFRGQYHLLIDVNPVKKLNGRIERLKILSFDVGIPSIDNVVNGNRNPEANFQFSFWEKENL